MEVYFTIEKTAKAEFKDRGSKFLAYAWPVKTVEQVKKVENSPEVELGIALIATTETVWSVLKAVSSEPEENN